MIEVIAMILSIVGTPFIAMKSEKLRLLGFCIWIAGNTLWMSYGWITGQWPVYVMFFWYQIWCIVGALGCYGAMRKHGHETESTK